MTETLAVEAHGLVKQFGSNRAVDGVDLAIDQGAIYGVLGPNGAGKTTTISMLATLLRPDAGSATIFGHDVERQAGIVRQLIGVTGQYASVDETLTATENLMIFGRLLGLSRRQARAKATELLEQFGLTDAAARPLKNFSGGMRRRLDLASSLIAQPPLIFLDEPTTGLDPRTRGQMWDTIRSLVAGGSTVLLTTQYLDEADQLANRVAVIDRGRVVAEGTPDDLKRSVGSASLIITLREPADAVPTMAVIERVLGVAASRSPESGRLTMPLTDPDHVTDLLNALRADSIGLVELSVQKPTLDEVFLTLTGHDTHSADPSTGASDSADPTESPRTESPRTDASATSTNSSAREANAA